MLLLIPLLFVILLKGDLIDDIGGLFSHGFHSLEDAVKKVWHAITHVISWVGRVFGHVGDAWRLMWHAMRDVGTAFESVGQTLWHTATGIIRVILPAHLLALSRHIIGWARHAIHDVAHFVLVHVNEVLRWAEKRLSELRHDLLKSVHWLEHLIRLVAHWIDHVGDAVAHIVLHPKRLVHWILGDLIEPLIAALLRELSWLAHYVVRFFVHHVGEVADDLERAFTRLL